VFRYVFRSQTKEIFESVALQRFQKFLCGSFTL
jgi:hypothetical protein